MNTAPFKPTTLARSLALAGALAALAFTSVASAASPSDSVPSIRVRYDDLNLTTASGVASLYSRISRAADAVCPRADIRDLRGMDYRNQCRADAVARAVSEVNNAKLAMLHTARVTRG
jgi:UrcA family protein